ncbi:TetR/AcrR family transcriptional regulator [Virgibacillus ihumii]|uniref:TetR/AcrR family transcriptional regulator n=1 Tax=Virgibacillus ihumii TaxID=2686091 RepID=UPI00157E0028|nr:TetR/AcrR family transcriptional regulator [Virgibacillus ihumii]
MAQRHEELLDAAVQLFQRHGFHATSVADITKACGISKGAFYKHFSSKENMILELLQRYYDDMFREADRFAEGVQQTPLLVLKRKISIELEKSIEYRSFFIALVTDFPPYEKGEISEFLNRIRQTHHQWHRQALLDAFGPQNKAYLNDLTIIMEGIIHSYLMRMVWKGPLLPLDRLGDFIAENLKVIVDHGDALSPMLPDFRDNKSGASVIKSMEDDLKLLLSELKTESAKTPSTEKDIQSIELLVEELEQETPREFLVDALLAQLYRRSYLKKELTKIMTAWEIWKGDLT